VAGDCVGGFCQTPPRGVWVLAGDVQGAFFAAMAYDTDKQVATLSVYGNPALFQWASQGSPPQWKLATPPSMSGYGASMVYDANQKVLVLFGGALGLGMDFTADGLFAVTNVFDGQTWTFDNSTPAPPALFTCAAYDTDKQRMVLFGGYGAGSVHGDTWFHTGSWSEQPMAASDAPIFGCAAAYDAFHKQVVRYGGGTDITMTQTTAAGTEGTRLFDGTAWTSPPSEVLRPPKRLWAAMAYDSRRRRVVLHGGRHLGMTRDDTWEWDGNAWVRTSTGLARYGHAMVYDPTLRRMLLAGGGETVGTASTDSWLYSTVGQACKADSDCDTNHCTDGLCCETSACTMAGYACNVPSSPGTCALKP
jgi:hypothetical protein